jgi:hypothetical protein
VLLAIAVGIGGQYLPQVRVERLTQRFARLSLVAQAAAIAVGLMIVDTLGPPGVAPSSTTASECLHADLSPSMPPRWRWRHS